MYRSLASLLLANAAFNVFVWPAFLRRVARDDRARDDAGRPTTFLIVHVVLIGIALALAATSAAGGIATLRRGSNDG